MAARIRVLAIKADQGPLDIDDQVTPKGILFRAQGLTKASISGRLSRDVQQLYEYVQDDNENGEYCSIDESVLSALDDGTTIYAKLADEQPCVVPHKQKDPTKWQHQDVLAAHLCAAVYEDDPVSAVNRKPELQCMDSCHVSCHGDVKFLLADIGCQRFIAVRGSVTVRDWQHNFKLLPVVPICGGFLHQGFAEYSEFFPKDAISSWVQGDGSCKQVIMAGHSLGGALASIVALHSFLSLSPTQIENEVLHVVTFGSPFYATGEVCKFIDSKGWKKYFRNYVLEDDPVPRLLNIHSEHWVYRVVVSALLGGNFEIIHKVASLFVKLEPKIPHYSPLGMFIYLHRVELSSANDKSYKIDEYHLSGDTEVMTKLGKPALTGEWGLTAAQQHSMKCAYLQYLSELDGAKGINKLVKQAAKDIGERASWLMQSCAGRKRDKKLSVGHNYECSVDGQYVLVSIKSVNPDGTYRGVCLDGPCTELESIVPEETRKAGMTSCTLNVLMSTRTEGGMIIPTHVQITSEVVDAKHVATSLLWLCDLKIEGLEFRSKKLKVVLQDLAGRLRVHFNGELTLQSAQGWQSERPVDIQAFHMFYDAPFKFTAENTRYKLNMEQPFGALSPLENIIDSQSPMLMTKALYRVILEAFLGETAALPQASRMDALQGIKLFQCLKTLEMLTSNTQSIDQFMIDNLVTFPEQYRHADIRMQAIKKLLEKDVPSLANSAFSKIAKFVFEPHSISFPRQTKQKVLTAAGALSLGGGLIFLTGGAAPAIFYGGFSAATAQLGVAGFGAACAGGAAGVGAGSLGLWWGKPLEHTNDSYKGVLTSFVEQLGGDAAGVQLSCLSLEEKVEKLVLTSDTMQNSDVQQDLFRRCKFCTHRFNQQNDLLSTDFMQGIWRSCPGKLCVCDATSSSKELAARHLFCMQIVRSIRLEVLHTVYIAVVGMQNAGKSSFIGQLWPFLPVQSGGGDKHTVEAKPFRINEQVVVVDFPGINDWSQVGFIPRTFMHMATCAVVLLKCEDVEERGRQFLDEVRTHLSDEQIVVFVNQADRYPDMIRNRECAEQLRGTYASKERLHFDRERIFLTAMLATDDDGNPSEEKLMRCVAKGINGPSEVREHLQASLFHLLKKHVSLT